MSLDALIGGHLNLAQAETRYSENSLGLLKTLAENRLIAAGASDADVAHWFQEAFDVAESAGVRMTQLRAALRLCRLWRNQGRDDADRLLRSVYDTFTEGFVTPDLTEARELLEGLPSQSTG